MASHLLQSIVHTWPEICNMFAVESLWAHWMQSTGGKSSRYSIWTTPCSHPNPLLDQKSAFGLVEWLPASTIGPQKLVCQDIFHPILTISYNHNLTRYKKKTVTLEMCQCDLRRQPPLLRGQHGVCEAWTCGTGAKSDHSGLGGAASIGRISFGML